MKKYFAILAGSVLAVSTQATTYNFTPSNADLNDLDHHDAYIWGISSTALQNELLPKTNSNKTGGEVILSVTLTISNIYDWKKENDHLYINLLDDPKKPTSGNVTVISGENPNAETVSNGNYFDVKNRNTTLNGTKIVYSGSTAIDVWSDTQTDVKGAHVHTVKADGKGATPNYVHSFNGTDMALLTSYIVDATASGSNMFGLGFDPECHYYNTGVCLTIVTGPKPVCVPDAGTSLALLGMGLSALAAARRFARA